MNFLIDPNDVIDYNRSDADLETFWLFTLSVAGKTAKTQARLLNAFLSGLEGGSAFDRLRKADQSNTLLTRLIESRLGQFNRLLRSFRESTSVNLRTCTLDDLEAIHGCGPKSARMFLMFTRPDQQVAALDTHILKFLSSKGLTVPKSTPPAGKTYRFLEEKFIAFAQEANTPVADFDLAIWKHYSGK